MIVTNNFNKHYIFILFIKQFVGLWQSFWVLLLPVNTSRVHSPESTAVITVVQWGSSQWAMNRGDRYYFGDQGN